MSSTTSMVHIDIGDGEIHSWYVRGLWSYAEKFPIVEMDIVQIIKNSKTLNHRYNRYNASDWARVLNADINYPVVYHSRLGLMDGAHRIMKAILNGDTDIKAHFLTTLPKPGNIYSSRRMAELNGEEYERC